MNISAKGTITEKETKKSARDIVLSTLTTIASGLLSAVICAILAYFDSSEFKDVIVEFGLLGTIIIKILLDLIVPFLNRTQNWLRV